MQWVKNIKSKRMFTRILTLLLSMAVLMFLLTMLFFRLYLTNSYRQRNQESARLLLNTAGQYVDMAMLDTGRAMQQLLWNPDLTAAILIPDEVSYQAKAKIDKALSGFVQDNPLVEHACLISYTANTLYDDEGHILPLGQAPQRIYLHQYNGSAWEQLLTAMDFSTQLLTVNGSAALLQEFPTPEHNGALLVELCEKELFHFLDHTLQDSQDYMEVRDASGTLLYVNGKSVPAGGARQTLAGEEGWQFSYWQQGVMLPTAMQTLQIAAVWALVFGLVSALASLLITNQIYRPIARLREAVTGQETAEPSGNELEQVQHSYEAALRQKADLSQELAEMAPIVRERLYKNLLSGRSMTQDYLIDRLAYLKSPFSPDDLFLVLSAEPENAGGADPDELMGGLYRELLQRRGSLRLAAAWECLLLDDYSLAVIMAFPGEGNPSLQKKEQLELCALIGSLWHRLSAEPLPIGCSHPVRGANGLHYAWQQARQDLHYRQYHGGDAPASAESADCARMLESARNGEVQRAELFLEALLAEIRQAPAAQRRQRSTDLLDALAQTLVDLQASEDKMDFLLQGYQAQGGPSESELREIAHTALRLIAVCGQRSRIRYVEQARKYIEEHCTDSHLSLDMVAENVGINSTYLSRLFYELGKSNFVNYVNGCRVDHAKRLLRQSKISVQETGYCSGFNSMQNFNRVFKRHTGLTPGAYRKSLAQKEMSE